MALDQNDLAALKTLFAEQTTAAVKAAVDPLSAELTALKTAQASTPKALTLEDVQTVLGDKLKGIPTREDLAAEIAKVAAANAAKGDAPPGDKPPGDKPVDVTASPEFKALQERFEARERESAAEREQAAQEARRRVLRDTIAKNGFQGRQEHVARYLEAERAPDGKPLLRLDDKGNLAWAREHLGAVRTFPLEEGIKGWAQTDDGKAYLPAKGAEGTGDQPGTAGSGQKVTPLKDLGKAIGGKLLQNNG